MDLKSVEDIESELEICKGNLKRLQKAMTEEKFKMIYLQTTMDRQKRDHPEAFHRKDENFNAEQWVFSRTVNINNKPQRRNDEYDGLRTKVSDPGGAKLHLAGNTVGIMASFGRERSRFSGKTGKPVPIPVPPRKSTFQRGDTAPGGVSRSYEGEVCSDREYDDVELNENFVRNNLLTPKVGARDSQRSLGSHQENRRPVRHSRDFDSGDDGRLSPSFPHIQHRASRSSGCSTPDRRSDGYLSSDHDDSSSAGIIRTILKRGVKNHEMLTAGFVLLRECNSLGKKCLFRQCASWCVLFRLSLISSEETRCPLTIFPCFVLLTSERVKKNPQLRTKTWLCFVKAF